LEKSRKIINLKKKVNRAPVNKRNMNRRKKKETGNKQMNKEMRRELQCIYAVRSVHNM
jgi:hypothetical protein